MKDITNKNWTVFFRRQLTCLLIIVCPTTIQSCNNENGATSRKSEVGLNDNNQKSIKVIAHRGDWLNFPENSVKSIESCIKMGVDIVEIDIRQTKDGKLILMHDDKIDRTTNGKGLVKDWNLKDLKKLYLKDRFGNVSHEKIPTLEEALITAKNRIFLKLDKSYRVFELTYKTVLQFDQLNEVIFKTHVSQTESTKIISHKYKINLMPMLEFPMESPEEFVNEHLKNPQVIGFEFILPQDDISYINEFEGLRLKGKEVWVNSFWASFNGGHDDGKFKEDPKVYDWYIKNHISMIQTDYPKRLLKYLRTRNLHK